MKTIKSITIFIVLFISSVSNGFAQFLITNPPATSTGTTSANPITVDGMYIGARGNGSTVLGLGALASVGVSGRWNVAIGNSSLSTNVSGEQNISIGLNAMNFTLGSYNTAIGTAAMRGGSATSINHTGTNNSAFGMYALYGNTSGNYNTASGYSALSSNTTGNNNIALGANALINITTGSNNVGIGNSANVSGATVSNELSIQNNIYGFNMTSNAGYIGIGGVPTTYDGTNYARLQIAGNTGTAPSLRLMGVPTLANTTGNYLYVGSDNVVRQTALPAAPTCSTNDYVAVYGTTGNLECSQIYDNTVNIGIAVGTSPTAKLDIDLINGSTPGTVRLRNLQVNTAEEYMNPVLIDANGNLWKASSALLQRSTSSSSEHTNELSVQQIKINQLEQELKNLREIVEKMMSNGNSDANIQGSIKLNTSKAKLFQNAPNPFNQSTVIKYSIPANAKQATIHITSLAGVKIKEFNLIGKGNNGIRLNGGELAAGTYVYSLIIDDTFIDAKQMILTR